MIVCWVLAKRKMIVCDILRQMPLRIDKVILCNILHQMPLCIAAFRALCELSISVIRPILIVVSFALVLCNSLLSSVEV